MTNPHESMGDAERVAVVTGQRRGVRCSLWTEGEQWAGACAAFAERFQLPVAAPGTAGIEHCLVLGERTALLANAEPRGRPLFAVFDAATDALPPRFRNPGATNEALLRAVGVRQGRRPSVIDATAGLAVDALLMAAAGCEVRMIERSPPLLIMLERGLRRWLQHAELSRVASRLTLCQGDALTLLDQLPAADVIYLDPMYDLPNRRAAPAGAMQALQGLHGAGATGADRLLTLAMRLARHRVVVKRPRKAPALLDDPPPHHCIMARSTRFDVYAAAAST